MFAVGKKKPESRKFGNMINEIAIIACCWVLDTVEMNSPVPSTARRNKPVRPRRSRTLPRIGTPNT